MNSKSAVFEDGYERFLSDVLNRGIQSVERVETDSVRMVVLARCRRIVMTRSTGLIHMEELVGSYLSDEDAVWRPCDLAEVKFWASSASLKDVITAAWDMRIRKFIPPGKDCFPHLPEKGQYSRNLETASESDYYQFLRSADSEREIYVDLAARRRVGSKANTQAAVKTLVQGLWRFLVDEKLVRTCLAYFGPRATIKDYNLTVKRRKELLAREIETPNLAPLIGAFIQAKANFRSGRVKIRPDVLLQAKAWFFGPELSPAAWRYVAAGNRRFVESMVYRIGRDHHGEIIDDPASCADMLNLIASADERYPLTFLVWVLELSRDIRRVWISNEHESFVRFFRLAGREANLAKKRKRLTKFLRGDVLLAWDWFVGSDGRWDCDTVDIADGIKTLQKNATWSSVMRAQQAWHAARAERERLRREADEHAHQQWLTKREETRWVSLVDTTSIDDVAVTPLTNGRALFEEGQRMDHCVGNEDYFRRCVRGTSRIFHLLASDETATMEIISRDLFSWHVKQVFGHADEDSSDKMWNVAKAVAITYSQLSKAAKLRT